MNILVIGNYYTGAFGKHVAETLEDMKHSVFRFEPGIRFNHNSIFGKRWNNIKYTLYNEVFSKMNTVQNKNINPLFKIVENNKIDLAIILHDYLTASQVEQLKKITQSPVILWFPDALSNFKKSMFLTANYDVQFFVDKYISNTLKTDFRINTGYLPQACYPKYHFKTNLTENEKQIYGCEIANAGNMYPARIALYRQLSKYNIKMWGSLPPVWANDNAIKPMMQKKHVHHEEKSKAFNGAKIVLNNLHPAVINGTNKRTFEIGGCGAFQLVKYRPALDDLFDVGKEIIAYLSFDDMIEKIEYYLKNDDERTKIAEAGYKRAHKDHTLEIRLISMFKTIFG